MKYTLTTSDIKYIHTIASKYIHMKFISEDKTPITRSLECQDGDAIVYIKDGFIQNIKYGKPKITDKSERETYEDAGILEEMEQEFYNSEYWEDGHPVLINCGSLTEQIFWENNKLTKIMVESCFFDVCEEFEKTDLKLRTDEDYLRKFNFTKKELKEYGYIFLRTKDYLIHALEQLNVPKHKINEDLSLLLKDQ